MPGGETGRIGRQQEPEHLWRARNPSGSPLSTADFASVRRRRWRTVLLVEMLDGIPRMLVDLIVAP